jgi:hypothetical protein
MMVKLLRKPVAVIFIGVGVKLREHVLKLFNTEYIENRIIDLFKLQGIANE